MNWKEYITKYRWVKLNPEMIKLMPELAGYDATNELLENIQTEVIEKLIADIPNRGEAIFNNPFSLEPLKQQLRDKYLGKEVQ